jgi:hypothetical protein
MSVEGKSDTVTLDLKAIPGAVVTPAAPPPDASGRKIGGIVALSVGGGAIVVGAVLLTLQLTTKCDILTDPNACDPPAPTPPYGIISAVMFGVGGAGIIAGAVLLATLPKSAKSAVVPVISPGFVGLRGRF